MIEPNDQHKYQHSQSAQVSSMLNLDGRVFVKGSRRSKLLISDLYHTLLLMTWPQFIALISGSYLLINVFFAVIYYLCGPDSLDGVNKFSEWGRFSDCFFFSVQTLATIG